MRYEWLELVGEARDGLNALRLAVDLKPDVAILDLSMPGLNGIEVAARLLDTCPQCRVLILTVHEDAAYLRQLLDLGVAGYVLKRSATEELRRAIRAVAAGGIYLDPAIAARAVGRPGTDCHWVGSGPGCGGPPRPCWADASGRYRLSITPPVPNALTLRNERRLDVIS